MTPDELRDLAAHLRLAYNVGLLQPMLDAAGRLEGAADRMEAEMKASEAEAANRPQPRGRRDS